MNRILTTGLIAAFALTSGCSRQEDAPETTQAPEGAAAPSVAATPEEPIPAPAPPAAESAPAESTPDPVSIPEAPPIPPIEIPASPVEVPTTPADAIALLVQQGGELFGGGSCFRCHGADAKGGKNGPDLTDGEWAHGDGSAEAIAATIKAGVTAEQMVGDYEFPMEPMARMTLSDADMAAIAAYIRNLGEGSE